MDSHIHPTTRRGKYYGRVQKLPEKPASPTQHSVCLVFRDIAESAKAIIKFGPHAPYLIEKSLRNALDFKPPKLHKRRLPALIGGIFLGLILGIISVLILFLWFN